MWQRSAYFSNVLQGVVAGPAVEISSRCAIDGPSLAVGAQRQQQSQSSMIRNLSSLRLRAAQLPQLMSSTSTAAAVHQEGSPASRYCCNRGSTPVASYTITAPVELYADCNTTNSSLMRRSALLRDIHPYTERKTPPLLLNYLCK